MKFWIQKTSQGQIFIRIKNSEAKWGVPWEESRGSNHLFTAPFLRIDEIKAFTMGEVVNTKLLPVKKAQFNLGDMVWR
jgi:hypothetical protein